MAGGGDVEVGKVLSAEAAGAYEPNGQLDSLADGTVRLVAVDGATTEERHPDAAFGIHGEPVRLARPVGARTDLV